MGIRGSEFLFCSALFKKGPTWNTFGDETLVEIIVCRHEEVGRVGGDCMEFAQDRDRWRTLVSMIMNFRVPQNAGNSLIAAKPGSFSRRTLLHGVNK